jgi:hypothetical protein
LSRFAASGPFLPRSAKFHGAATLLRKVSSPRGWARAATSSQTRDSLDGHQLRGLYLQPQVIPTHRWEYSFIPGPCSAFGEALAGWVSATEAFTSTSALINANAIFFNIAIILLCSLDRDYSLSLGI